MKLFYRIKSNSKKRRYKNFTFSTDSNSIRSTYEIPFSKEKDEFRILHLGDSWTFGFGLNDDQTYSYLLEKKLQERYPNKKIVSINAGCIGYSLPQSFLLLEHRGFKYDPDIIIFKNNLNFMGLESFRNMNMCSNNNSIVKRIRSILWKSNLYLYLRRINLIRLHSKSLGKTNTNKEHKEPNKYGNNLEEYELNLFNDIVEMTRSRGKKLVFLNLGVEKNFLMSNSMNKAASNRNVPLVKVACDLSIDADFYKYYKGHPGPSNAKIIADSLFEYIVGIEAIEEK